MYYQHSKIFSEFKLKLFNPKILASTVAIASLFTFYDKSVHAAPVGGIVTAGTASYSTLGQTTTISQTSDRAVINWQSFDLALNETAKFIVPNANSATLNRITGGSSTTVSGRIESNGIVFFTNPNGLVFDANSQVSANGFFVATQAIEAARFISGSVTAASLTNLGAGEVRLDGSIIAPTVTALGDRVSVGGTIESLQGDILLSSASLTTIGATAVIRADAAEFGKGGKVVIWSDQHTDYFGSIAARGGMVSGDGGFVEVSGKQTLNFQGLVNTMAPHGKTGTLLLDPTDITISTGTDSSTTTTGTVTGTGTAASTIVNVTTLQAALATSNVIIDANAGSGTGSGLITVTSAIAAASSGTNSLTLQGAQIVINANIAMAAGASLTLTANRASVWQDPSTIITAATISGSAVDGFTLNGANRFTTIGTITNLGTAGISVKNNQALGIASGITLDGGTGGVSILAPNYDVTLAGGLTVKGSYLRLDMGSKNLLGGQTINATGMELYYTSATSGNAATINLGAGNFIFVTDNRATTAATIINNSSSLPTAFTVLGSGLSITAASTNGQGVVYGGTVDIRGITSADAAKDLRYIEGTGIGVSASASTFSGSLLLVGSGAGFTPTATNFSGFYFTANLTTGAENDGTSNLTLIQTQQASTFGIYIEGATVTAGGAMTLNQTGKSNNNIAISLTATAAPGNIPSSLKASGNIVITQSGNSLSSGISITSNSSLISSKGNIIVLQSGSASRTGINLQQAFLTASKGDIIVTQSGTASPSATVGGLSVISSSRLTAMGTITLNQLGRVGGIGISVNANLKTDIGAILINQLGSATGDGISLQTAKLFSGSHISILQSGSVGSSSVGINLFSATSNGSSLDMAAANSNSWITIKTNNQKLSVTSINVQVTVGKLRIDLGTAAMTGANSLNAAGLDVFFTGATAGNNATIAVGSGSFTRVIDNRSTTAATVIAGTSFAAPTTTGLNVTGVGATNLLGVVYGGSVELNGSHQQRRRSELYRRHQHQPKRKFEF